MSIIGTGIAAGVANAGQTAQTQTATQTAKDAARASSAEQTDRLTLSQLHDAGAARDTDQDLPDGQAPGYEDLYEGSGDEPSDNPNDQIHGADAPTSSRTDVQLKPSYGPAGAEEHPLFHALDVKA